MDRLEEAGFVRRERDPRDRRRVVIRLVLETALRDVASVFLPMMRDWQEMAARYSDDELRLIVDFYDRMEGVLREHLTRPPSATAAITGPARTPAERTGRRPWSRGEGPGAPWLERPASGLGSTLAQEGVARGAESQKMTSASQTPGPTAAAGSGGTALARQSTWPGRA